MALSVAKRNEKIRKWRGQGVSQSEIARRLGGITRQRVQQIERKLKLGPRRDPKLRKTYEVTCKNCEKVFTSSVDGRLYCSRACFFAKQHLRLTPEQRLKSAARSKLKNRQRARDYYHNVFKKRQDWRKIVRQRNAKYAAGKR